MKSLLIYEFKKTFQKIKWPSLTLIVLTAFFLISGYFIAQQTNWNYSGVVELLTMFSFVGLVVVFLFSLIAPMVASINSFNKDLNNQHAIFETYIPQNGWNRLGAKYISYFALIESGILFSALIIWSIYSIVNGVVPADFQLEMNFRIQEVLSYINANCGGLFWAMTRVILGAGLALLSVTIFFNFFITLHSVLRHRVKWATPATFFLATMSSLLMGWFDDRFFGSYNMMTTQVMTSTPETIFNYALSIFAFIAIGWMLEHKTELK